MQQNAAQGQPSGEGAKDGTITSTALSAVTPTNSLFDFKAIASKVDSLEHDLSSQIKSNEGMLRVLRIVNRIAKKTGKSVQDVLKNKEYIDSLTEGSPGKVSCYCYSQPIKIKANLMVNHFTRSQ